MGAPNAGKSTLLAALSRAQPRIGSYAFTTLKPQLGTVIYDDFFSLSVADIPGLIEGAHENRGLGHGFLRHIERTRALAYVLDMAPKEKERRPWEQLEELQIELEMYKPGLGKRRALIVANKMDEPHAENTLEELRKRLNRRMKIVPICAVLCEGVEELKEELRTLLENSV